MLNFLLAQKIAVGRILSVVGATATVVIFEYSFGLDWYISIPAAVVAYVTMPILWVALLDSLVLKIPALTMPFTGSRRHRSEPNRIAVDLVRGRRATASQPRQEASASADAPANDAHSGERVSKPAWRELIKRRRTEIADASARGNLRNMEPGFPLQMQRGRNAGSLPASGRRKTALVRGLSLGYRLGGRLAIRLGAGRRL